jgi:hypothetical protein
VTIRILPNLRTVTPRTKSNSSMFSAVAFLPPAIEKRTVGFARMSEIDHIAIHEASHGVVTTVLFRRVDPSSPPLVEHIEITGDSGHCVNRGITHAPWPHRHAMREAQALICLSGGIGEAIYRGEQRRDYVLRFAERFCGCDIDLRRARSLMNDHGFDEQRLVEKTLTLLLDHWPAIKLVASGLVCNRRVEGAQLERWIGYALPYVKRRETIISLA